MKSSFPSITSWVIFETLSLTTPLIVSTLPAGIEPMPPAGKFLFLLSVNSRLGSWTVRTYGPTPGAASRSGS